MSIDLHELTGVYAVGALPAPERDAVREHLRGCRRCAEESRELTETAALLGLAASAPPPAGLRRRVLAAVAVTHQEPPLLLGRAAGRPGRSRRAVRQWPLQVAACVAALTVGFGVHSGLTSAPAPIVASATVSADPARGALTIAARDLPDPGAGRVYQLWLVRADSTRGAGTFVPSPDGTGTTTIPAPGRPTTLMVTAEPAGGSPGPTSAPVLTIALPVA